MHRPSPHSVNMPICARIGPVATTSSFTYSFAVPIDSWYWPMDSLVNSTPSTYLPG